LRIGPSALKEPKLALMGSLIMSGEVWVSSSPQNF